MIKTMNFNTDILAWINDRMEASDDAKKYVKAYEDGLVSLRECIHKLEDIEDKEDTMLIKIASTIKKIVPEGWNVEAMMKHDREA